jgi:hypothetical protein
MAEHKLYNLACGYADAGLKLLWFKLDKTPGIPWSNESSSDKAELKKWFYNVEAGQRRIGIKTGQDSRGVVVIDIDVNKKDRQTGEIADPRSVQEKLEYIAETYGALPDTLSVHTPSGGLHLYYIADRPVATLKKIFPNDPLDVDSRGDGGVVVAPDEVDYVTDSEYDEFHPKHMARLPDWMYDVVARRNPLTRKKTLYTGEIPLIPEMETAISDALMFMDCSDRDAWIKYGHAIKSLNSDDAKRLWMEWGQKHKSHNSDYAEKTWQSLAPSEIGIATLFYDAKAKGFEPESVSADILMKEQEHRSITDKPRFIFQTSKDAMKPRPPIEWIVENFMVKAGLCMVTGDAGSGKTWTALDMGVSIAEGQPWLGRAVIQGAVLVIDEESGDHRLATRLTKILRGHNGSESTPLYYTTMQGADIRDALDMYEIEKFITEKKIKFVIIDALMDVILGADENSVKDVMPAFAQLKQMIERTGCSVLVIHHNDKAGKGYRGSTAIKGAVDLLFEVDKAEKSDCIKIKTVKVRDAEPVDFKAKMLFGDTTFRMETDDGPAGDKMSLTKGERFVLEYLSEHGISLKIDIEAEGKRLGFPRSAHDAIYSLQKKGYIGRANAESASKTRAEYGIVEAKKYEVDLLIDKGYVMGNLEERNLC